MLEDQITQRPQRLKERQFDILHLVQGGAWELGHMLSALTAEREAAVHLAAAENARISAENTMEAPFQGMNLGGGPMYYDEEREVRQLQSRFFDALLYAVAAASDLATKQSHHVHVRELAAMRTPDTTEWRAACARANSVGVDCKKAEELRDRTYTSLQYATRDYYVALMELLHRNLSQGLAVIGRPIKVISLDDFEAATVLVNAAYWLGVSRGTIFFNANTAHLENPSQQHQGYIRSTREACNALVTPHKHCRDHWFMALRRQVVPEPAADEQVNHVPEATLNEYNIGENQGLNGAYQRQWMKMRERYGDGSQEDRLAFRVLQGFLNAENERRVELRRGMVPIGAPAPTQAIQAR